MGPGPVGLDGVAVRKIQMESGMDLKAASTQGRSDAEKNMTRIVVEPGACGFSCLIEAEKKGPYEAVVRLESECEKINKFAEEVENVDFMRVLKGTFNENPIVQAAGRCKMHQSCVIPCAVTKAVEAELGMAVKKDTTLTYKP